MFASLLSEFPSFQTIELTFRTIVSASASKQLQLLYPNYFSQRKTSDFALVRALDIFGVPFPREEPRFQPLLTSSDAS